MSSDIRSKFGRRSCSRMNSRALSISCYWNLRMFNATIPGSGAPRQPASRAPLDIYIVGDRVPLVAASGCKIHMGSSAVTAIISSSSLMHSIGHRAAPGCPKPQMDGLQQKVECPQLRVLGCFKLALPDKCSSGVSVWIPRWPLPAEVGKDTRRPRPCADAANQCGRLVQPVH